jgi:Protein of unknown function (DUF3108)
MRRIILILSLCALAPAGCMRSVDIEPAETSQETLVFREATIPDGEILRYAATWNGVTAGTMEVRFDRGSIHDVVEGVTKSTGLPGMLFPFLGTGRLVFPGDDPLPTSYETRYKERDRVTVLRVTFDRETGRVRGVRERDGKTKQVDLESRNAVDPLSLIYMLRRLRFGGRRRIGVDIVTWDKPYRATIERVGRETISVSAGTFETKVFGLRSDPIGSEGKPRVVMFWLGDDKTRVPIRFQSALPFGHLTFELQSREIAPREER